MDDERLRQPVTAGLPDYFDELLERIRDIRASEQRLYLRVKDILALAADYQPSDLQTQAMFKTVQNKLHFAVTGLTAPEIIAQRLNPDLPNMGLTSWSGARVIKKDVKVAKNYLKEAEIKELNRIVGMFLDYAEDQAQRRKQRFFPSTTAMCCRGSAACPAMLPSSGPWLPMSNSMSAAGSRQKSRARMMPWLPWRMRRGWRSSATQGGGSNHELSPLPDLQAQRRGVAGGGAGALGHWPEQETIFAAK
jgi:hypothetical protein